MAVLARPLGLSRTSKSKAICTNLDKSCHSKAEHLQPLKRRKEPITSIIYSVSLIDHSDQVQTFNPTDEAGQPIKWSGKPTTPSFDLWEDYDGSVKLLVLSISPISNAKGSCLWGGLCGQYSLELEGFYLWSLTAEDTAITHVNRYSFRHLNQQALISDSVFGRSWTS